MRRVLWTFLIAIIFAGSGCGGGGNSRLSDPSSLTLSPERANLVQGNTLTLSITRNGIKVKPSGFTWQSSDPNVATVDRSGVVRGVKVGVVTITATSRSASGMATVGVVSPNPGAPKLSLSGTAFYEDKSFDLNGFTVTSPKPIRNTVVEAVAIDGFTTIGSGLTDNLGNIIIQDVDNSSRRGGVYLRILSKTIDGHNTKIEVKNNPAGNLLLSSASPDAVDDSQAISGILNIIARENGIGGAFNILDALSDASEFVQGQSGCPQPNPNCLPPLLTAYWEPGSAEGTFYNGQSAITILGGGGPGGDADEYDDSVIIHEYGHFILSKFFHDDSLGGLHGLTENDQDIRLSWSEGWANFFSSAVRNTSTYVDTIPGGVLLSFDLEDYSSIQTTILNAKAIYTTSEVAVAGVLWDIFDGLNAGENDALSLGFAPIWQTLLNVPPRPARASMESFWLAFEAGQSTLEIASLQTILGGRKIELKTDFPETNGEVALVLGDAGLQHRTFYRSAPNPTGDIDIIPFTVLANTTYTVKTLNLSNGADTLLEIRDSGGNLIASNDNPGNAIFSNCTINPLSGISSCPRNGPTNLAASVTFTSPGANTTLKAHVSRPLVAPPSAGLFGTYDIKLTSP